MNEIAVRIDTNTTAAIVALSIPLSLLIVLHDTQPADRPDILRALAKVFRSGPGRG